MGMYCRIVGHRRSWKLTGFDRRTNAWTSRCRRCSVELQRKPWPSQSWHPAPEPDGAELLHLVRADCAAPG